MEAIGAYVKAAVETLCGEYGLTFVAVVLVVGSYRRGAVDSGDVDILILPPEVRHKGAPYIGLYLPSSSPYLSIHRCILILPPEVLYLKCDDGSTIKQQPPSPAPPLPVFSPK